MPVVPNPRVLLAGYPSGYPVPDQDIKYDTTMSIDLGKVSLDGGFLTKTLYLSLDPYMRNRMKPGAWKVGQLFEGYGVGEVLRSEVPEFKPGDIVYGTYPFEYFTVHPASNAKAYRVLKNEEGLPLSAYLGVAGMPGKTAYYGLKAIAEPKKGESIFVSTGAGPVGSLVAQLAKADGLRVIASAGSAVKVDLLKKEFKVDQAFNYKESSTAKELADFGGIDIYWDNVGGETLDAAINALRPNGRIVVCGHISQYNDQEKAGIKNTGQFMYKQILMKGLYVGAYESKYGEEFYETIPKLIKNGEIKYAEDITVGLENAGKALLKIFHGENVGKTVLQIYP